MVLASDGIVEAPRLGRYSDGVFESERLVKILHDMHDRPLAQIKARILSELEAFTGGVYYDDVTFLLARRAA